MSPEIDEARVMEHQLTVMNQLGGLATALNMQTGAQLGLFEALQAHGPITSTDLATQTGLHERWLREWLYQQASAGIIDHVDGERFSVSPEMALVIIDRSSPASLAAFLETADSLVAGLAHVPAALESGVGQPYDAHGAELVTAIEGGTAVFIPPLLNEVLPALDGTVAALNAGGAAADVGCGAGVRTIAMAEAYPASRWTGYDTSLHALARAEENLAEAGLENLVFRNPDEHPLPADHSLDLVTFCDVVHDMAFPSQVLRAVHQALKPDGRVMIADVDVPDAIVDRLSNPMAPMMYGSSMAFCMSSGMAEEGGEGIGTFGLAPSVLAAMAHEAGFSGCRRLEVDDQLQAYYELAP